MDEQRLTGSPHSDPPSDGAPTLIDLAVDSTWQPGPSETPHALSHEVAVDGVHARPRLWPLSWFDRRRAAAELRASVEELGDASTETIDLTPDPWWKTGLKTLGAFMASAALAYVILTFPSQWVKVVYAAKHIGKPDSPVQIVKSTATSGSFVDAVVPSLSFRPPPSTTPTTPTPPAVSTNDSNPFATLGDNELVIPKIDVHAPVIWDSSFDEKIMLANLQKGVVHYGGTDLPNPTTGNVFITGHSSYYWWDKGQFKTVFALLDQLKTGDQVALTYQQQVYVYQVFDSKVVKPTQVDVLNTSEKPILSLMTCTPVGTSLNRLIVRANLVGVFAQGSTTAPLDAAQDKPTATPTTSTSPSSAPTPTETTPTTAPLDAARDQPTTTPPATTAPAGPSQSLDLLPGLDSWIGR